MSGDVAALPILPTVIASVMRHTSMNVRAFIYVRFKPPGDLISSDGRLNVTFAEAEKVKCGDGRRIPSEMFDRFAILGETIDRVLILDWDQLVLSSVDEYYLSDFQGMYCSLADGRRGWSFGHWANETMYPPELWGRDTPCFRLGGMFDVNRCREASVFPEMLEVVRRTGCCEMAALNHVIRNQVNRVHRKWSHLPFEKESQGIRHWAGPKKPWVTRDRMWMKQQRTWIDLRESRW